MKNDKRSRPRVEPLPLDEHWWSSILADEDKLAQPASASNPESGAHPLPRSAQRYRFAEVDWQAVERSQREEAVEEGTVVGYNRGGLLLNFPSFQGFLPISHLAELVSFPDERQREGYLASYMGRSIRVRIIESEQRRGRIVVSERLAGVAPGKRQEIFSTIYLGERIRGRVTNITAFGVFVDLGGVEGLVHISELSWGRVTATADHVRLGQDLEVLVLEVAPDRGRVSLSVKRMQPNPWATVLERYPQGNEFEAVITDVVRFGVFARLEEGLEGLIHVSEMGASGVTEPAAVFTPGQRVRVSVLVVDPARQRLSLRLLA